MIKSSRVVGSFNFRPTIEQLSPCRSRAAAKRDYNRLPPFVLSQYALPEEGRGLAPKILDEFLGNGKAG
jgi:hypothetical protein